MLFYERNLANQSWMSRLHFYFKKTKTGSCKMKLALL